MSGLSQFETTRFDQFEEAIRSKEPALARTVSSAIKREFVAVHDGFVDASAATLSYFVDATSPEDGEAMGRAAMERHMEGDWFVQYIGPHDPSPQVLRDRISSIITTWHWHPSLITVTEDEEKVTVHTHPCGSGMRLELRGKYDGDGAWHRSVAPSRSTFMEKDFPMYCNHCPEMNRAGLKRGATTWLVEGWRPFRAPERSACRQHAYKRLVDVPDEFYRRVGLQPPEHPTDAASTPAPRLFGEAELVDLATHPCDRAVGLLERGDSAEALEAAEAARQGWSGMHGAYPIWLATLWAEGMNRLGSTAADTMLERVAPELFASLVGADAEAWAAFWSMHLHLEHVGSDGDETTFVIGSRSVLTDDGPVSVDAFCRGLQRGLAARGWVGMGRFEAHDHSIVHRLPRAA